MLGRVQEKLAKLSKQVKQRDSYVNKLVEVNLKIIIQYNGKTKFYF